MDQLGLIISSCLLSPTLSQVWPDCSSAKSAHLALPRVSTLPALRAMTAETTSTVTWAASPSVGVSQASTSTTWPAPPPWLRGPTAVTTSTACWLTGVSGVSRRSVSAGRTPGGWRPGQARVDILSSPGGMELSVSQVRATGSGRGKTSGLTTVRDLESNKLFEMIFL